MINILNQVSTFLAMSQSTKQPIVRLYSLSKNIQGQTTTKNNVNCKIIHFLRHAQGFHNVEDDYKNPAFTDARLTDYGIEQCNNLSKKLQNDSSFRVDCIISSPMTRTLQTAQYSFQHILQDKSEPIIPFIACEDWRETVNYLCDKRRDKQALIDDFPSVDFSQIQDDNDPIWHRYENVFGTHEQHTKHRESGDDVSLDKRARAAWKYVSSRPERKIAIVSHSAFFMHMFTRLNVVEYEDSAMEDMMLEGFEQCEMRSFAYELIK